TLSQVTFDSGLGISCSQPLFAKRPSRIIGSGRNRISRPESAGALVALSELLELSGLFELSALLALPSSPVPAMNPSWRALRQNTESLANGLPSSPRSVHAVFVLPSKARVQ